VARAHALLRSHGCLLLENLIEAPRIERLHAAYVRRYRRYLRDREHADALQVGQARFMVTVTLRPPFSTPQLYANPLVLPIVRRALGSECLLGSFGSVVALPGAPDQHVHRDHPALFGEPALEAALPAFALTMILPLVQLDATNGTTRLWPGSHLVPDAEAERIEPQDPVVPPGGCLLLDYRLRHGGTANRSERVRPVLYSGYHRAWFRDSRNFKKQAPLQITARAYEAVAEEIRPLLATAHIGRWLR
jgi:ectoine hydroxylase-related dioxygenase (phytanoyl-CoA dioxygenase family)